MHMSAVEIRSSQAKDAAVGDGLGRPLQCLRVSVTDSCNFRCRYCMPADDAALLPDPLPPAQLVRLIGLFQRLGVRKVRLTGGEPLLRPELPQIVRLIRELPGIEDLALSTNGMYLPVLAAELRQAGLQRLTVSLDSLDDKLFGEINGCGEPAAKVIEGIRAAEKAGFAHMKINVVVQRGVNDETVVGIARFFRHTGHIVRFIEYMDVGSVNDWAPDDVVAGAETIQRIAAEFPVKPVPPNFPGEVARRFAYEDGGGEIGVITSVSDPFCASCDRARISADGHLFTCLFATAGTDLGGPLLDGADDDELLALIRSAWERRLDRYSEERLEGIQLSGKKLEMYRIGG